MHLKCAVISKYEGSKDIYYHRRFIGKYKGCDNEIGNIFLNKTKKEKKLKLKIFKLHATKLFKSRF